MKHPSSAIFARVLSILVLIISMIATGIPASVVQAGTATKSIVQTGAQAPGTQVTVKLQLAKPTLSVTPAAELVIVVDTSGSLSADMTSMKTTLQNFINNTISQYPGAVRVGITKIGNGTAAFDSNNSNNPGQNTELFVSGTTTPKSNSAIGVDKVVTIDSTNVSSLVSAISNIAVEPATNPNQPDGQNSYTSDIGPGMARGAGMFTSDSNKKFMILLTDGLANKGYCPITSSGGKAVSLPSGTQLQVLSSSDSTLRVGDPNGSYNSYVPDYLGTGTQGWPVNYPVTNGEPGVCKPYIVNKFAGPGLMADNVSPHYASSLPNNSILDQIASIYGGTKSSDLQGKTLDKVAALAQIAGITVTDQLNPNVFTSVDSWGWLANCDSGNHYATGGSFTPSGTGFTLIIGQTTTQALTNLCIYFYATIGSDPPNSNQSINTNSGGNQVLYNNSNGDTLATDTIGLGTITIADNVNLVPSKFRLANASGSDQYIFNTGDSIYIDSQITNTGTDPSDSGSVTRYYANQSSAVGANQNPPAPTSCINHGSFSPSPTTYDYDSFSGGTNVAKFSNTSPCASSWKQNTIGVYTARMDVNFQQASGGPYETSYADNQQTAGYAVITPPTNLTIPATTCNSVTFNWTNGTGITSYKIHILNTSKGTEDYYPSVTSPYTEALAGGPYNYTWGLIPQVTIGGVLQDGTEIPGPQFNTSACLHYTVTTESGVNLNPGSSTYASVPISFTNSSSWISQGGTVTVGIVGFVTSPSTCSSFSNPALFNNAGPAGSKLSAVMKDTNLASDIANPTTLPSPQVYITSLSNAPTATYTLCIGTSSSQSSDTFITPLTFSVQKSAWVQVGGATGGTTATPSYSGDVHSNGSISNISVPLLPVQQYFFVPQSSGVISAAGITSIANNQVSKVVSAAWQWSAYSQITTPAFSELYTNSPIVAAGQVTSGSPSDTAVAAACTAGGTHAYTTSTNVTIALGHPIALNSNCNNDTLIYFISGNLTVNDNIVDTSTNGTLTFVVDGNVSVAPGVATLDGMYIFSGAFSDGGGSVPLVVHGSLIGLAGSTPSATTGTFSPSGTTGLSRDLNANNDSQAAETIYFQPKYLYQTKDSLGASTVKTWTE